MTEYQRTSLVELLEETICEYPGELPEVITIQVSELERVIDILFEECVYE